MHHSDACVGGQARGRGAAEQRKLEKQWRLVVLNGGNEASATL